MKKSILFLLLCLTCCVMASCEKDNESVREPVGYAPGEIPGLGDAEGELTGTPFNLPRGVELVGDITGAGSQYDYWNLDYTTQNYSFGEKDGTIVTRSFAPVTRSDIRHFFGSGYGYVDLVIPMRNTNTRQTTVTFPAALILRNEAGNCQNGVLIKKIEVQIPAGQECHLNLSFYCGNASKSSAGSGDRYTFGVVSDAKPLLTLCEMVKNKKINIEEFDPTSYGDYGQYLSQKDRLQDIVWQVTDYAGLTEDDVQYIHSLPASR